MSNTKKIILYVCISALAIFLIGGFVYFFLKERGAFDVTTSSGASPDNALLGEYYSGVSSEEVVKDSVSIDEVTSADTQYVIRTGYIDLSADDMDTTLTNIQTIASEFSADTVSLSDSGKGADRTIYLSLKVDEAQFEDLFNRLKEMDVEFNSSSTQETEVTETVQDLQVRLENLQAQEEQLNEILDSATTVEDILAVQTELNSVRAQIELLEADLRNMERQTSYSYITVYISQSSTGSTLSDDEWQPLGILKDAARALVEFGKFLGTVLIWALVFSPVAAAIVVPVIIIQKKSKKVV